MKFGDHAIKVQKASIGITQVAGEMGVNAMSMLAGTTPSDAGTGRVLQLLNMVTPDELMDNDDYEGICWTDNLAILRSFPLLTIEQKSATTFKKSARNSAR